MRLITDLFAYCGERMPRWNTISISGYHMREAGATAAQEIAFTLANGIAYVAGGDRRRARGRPVRAAPVVLLRLPHALLRGGREVPRGAADVGAASCASGSAPTDPRSLMLRFHTQTGGATLTAQQPENNIVRTALEALAAVLGGTQSLHTNAYDEALALPTEEAAKMALRTQQVIAYETGVADVSTRWAARTSWRR